MASSKWVDKQFGQQLKKQRDKLTWTQPQMAKMLEDKGVAPMGATTLAKIEAGTRSVRINEAVAIADLFEVSLDELLGRQLPDDTSLTFAMTTLLGYVRDAENSMIQARGTVTDIGEQLEDAAERFDSPHVEVLQRTARDVARHLDKSRVATSRLIHIASLAIVDEGTEKTK
jgi:transcriptional regulator with XRE-family HTH domain